MPAVLMPIVNDLSRPFCTAAQEDRLVLPYCVATGRPFWPASPASPFRTAGEVEWRDVSAEGRLLSLVVYRRTFQTEFAAALPYGIALVEIVPGVRLMVHVVTPDEAPAPGASVRLCFKPIVAGGAKVLVLVQDATGE